MEYQNHSCEHADHEYVGTIKHAIVYGAYGEKHELLVDVFFLDTTGGHDPHYHGCCIRYSNEPEDYASYAEVRMIEDTAVLWPLYLQWCKLRGYKPQSYNWIVQNSSIELAKRDCYV